MTTRAKNIRKPAQPKTAKVEIIRTWCPFEAPKMGRVIINNEMYEYSELSVDRTDCVAIFSFKKFGAKDNNVVSLLNNGRWDCTCESFIYNECAQHGWECKHIQAARAIMAFMGRDEDAQTIDDMVGEEMAEYERWMDEREMEIAERNGWAMGRCAA
jgi:hypothetical protein